MAMGDGDADNDDGATGQEVDDDGDGVMSDDGTMGNGDDDDNNDGERDV